MPSDTARNLVSSDGKVKNPKVYFQIASSQHAIFDVTSILFLRYTAVS
jgi:hypothetical protein